MGDRLTGEQQSKQTGPTPYGDTFDRLLPEYMAIGMPYDLYWDGEFGTKRAFRKAYQLRIENERRIQDQNNWLMGQYVMAALNATPLLVAGLNVKPSTKLPEYPDKPLLEKHEEQKKEEARKQQEQDQANLALALFHAMTTQFNKNMEKKKAKGTGQ